MASIASFLQGVQGSTLKDPTKVTGAASTIKSSFGQLALSLSTSLGTLGLAALAKKVGGPELSKRFVSGQAEEEIAARQQGGETQKASGLASGAVLVVLFFVGLAVAIGFAMRRRRG